MDWSHERPDELWKKIKGNKNQMLVSVVIPTYDRGQKLLPTLRSILSNEIKGSDEVEVIIVDDGSPTPAKQIVESCAAAPPFSLHCIRQANAGPAAARNTGFRAAKGDIVIFMDDDIIAPSDLILKHVEAHSIRHNSVICGRCPFIEPIPVTPLFRFIDSLGFDPGRSSEEEFIEIDVVASGQVSIEREMFDIDQGVYRDDLATPAAEEFELSLRLREQGIPILLATRIIALHDHPIAIESLCRQQYKHAVGCAEAALKYPRTRCIEGLDNVISVNQSPILGGSPAGILKKACKRALATRRSRRMLLNTMKVIERALPFDAFLSPLYRVVMGLHFFAGVREGLQQYSGNSLSN